LKVGILQFFSWPERRVALPTVYERALQRIEVMDQNGYDAVWLTEHHFNDYSICPSIPVMGAYAAARTKRLRIGAGVTLAAFYHPLRLAEEIALLDILSGGRVNWGAGRGFDPREFAAFGIPLEESRARFREAVEVVVSAWLNERVSYRGRHFSFEDIEVLPKPLQRPHPPMWVAAGSLEALEWAAASGYSVLIGPHATHQEVARQHKFYREKLAAHGHSMVGRDLPVALLIAIAPSDTQAADVARQGAQWLLKTYMDPKVIGANGDPVQHYMDRVIVHGTPERVTDNLLRLRDQTRMTYLIGAPLSHITFKAFTDKVLPKLL
jgi:alkanesulfonate monooxygenase SsuD/methylene tetrahydromethanopterin reductase-like flavin-dependent oxidoreductase (luciferase family)